MAITIREEQDTGSNAVALTFTLGSGTTTSDLLVLVHSDNFYTAAELTTPTGSAASFWTLRHTYDGGTNAFHSKVWTAPVTTSGAQTVNANSDHTDNERYAAVFVLQDAPTFDTAANANGTVAPFAAPSVTPTVGKTDDLLICSWGSGGTDYTMPGSMTAYTERDVGSETYRSASEQLASDTATGTRSVTPLGDKTWFAVSVLIKSATAPGPAPNLFVVRSNLQLR